MRRLLQFLSLIALLVAPLAAPAAAMSAKAVAAECTDMGMEMAGHEMPAGDHGQGEACCIAIPPAIDPPLSALIAAPPIEHLAFVADNAPFHLGAGPKAEDPPPRSA
jgi:hypothetical protein